MQSHVGTLCQKQDTPDWEDPKLSGAAAGPQVTDTRSSVTAMLEQKRADARLCLFCRIVYGFVTVPILDFILLLAVKSVYIWWK